MKLDFVFGEVKLLDDEKILFFFFNFFFFFLSFGFGKQKIGREDG